MPTRLADIDEESSSASTNQNSSPEPCFETRQDNPTNIDYNIERLTIGNGGIFEKDVIYASANTSGDASTFWKIDSVNMPKIDGSSKTFCAIPIMKPKCMGSISFQVEQHSLRNKNPHCFTLHHLKKWMKKNPNFAIIVGGPGQRETSSSTIPFQARDCETKLINGKDGVCLDAALANSIGCLRNSEDVILAQRILENISYAYTNLRQCAPPVQQLKMKVRIQHVFEDMKRNLKMEKFKFFENIKSGIYLARILQVGIVAHIVCIDAKRRLIFDCEEKFSLSLCE